MWHYQPAPWYPPYDYLVVIDFEATCDVSKNENLRPIRQDRPEIIQFPAILLNVHTLEVEGQFNSLVRPVESPVLSKFCTSLTGITQSMVDKSPQFPEVLRKFEEWLKSYDIALTEHEPGPSFAIVTDGSYDMGQFLYKQCIISQIPYPSYATRWVNIRTIFTRAYRIQWVSLKLVLQRYGIPFVGRAHNGLDDSANICTILQPLLRCGCNVYKTERILLQTEEQEWNEKRILSDKLAGKYDLATVAPVSVAKECVYVYPTGVYGYSLEGCSFKPTMTMNTVDYSQQSVASISSSSCESIASDCSNKENSIPTMYIPSKVSSETKNRASPGSKDTTMNGSCGTASVGTSSRRYNKKKKNSQLKNSASASPNSCLKNGSNVGTDLDTDSSQSNKLDPHGFSLSHLQPIMVSELSSSRKV